MDDHFGPRKRHFFLFLQSLGFGPLANIPATAIQIFAPMPPGQPAKQCDATALLIPMAAHSGEVWAVLVVFARVDIKDQESSVIMKRADDVALVCGDDHAEVFRCLDDVNTLGLYRHGWLGN
ncbi:MAG: hypothetical protein IIC52_09375 [Proteobacteria bacterium]|nr:hypothetical protein [Pseudomonadota bacterium]